MKYGRHLIIELAMLLALALALDVNTSSASGPMPYTEEALGKVEVATAIMGTPTDCS